MPELKDGCVQPARGPIVPELVTPSGWQPGETTLTPGPALVGKVWEVWKP